MYAHAFETSFTSRRLLYFIVCFKTACVKSLIISISYMCLFGHSFTNSNIQIFILYLVIFYVHLLMINLIYKSFVLFNRSFILTFVRSITPLFDRSFIPAFAHSLIHPFLPIHLVFHMHFNTGPILKYLFTLLFVHSFVYFILFIHSFIHFLLFDRNSSEPYRAC